MDDESQEFYDFQHNCFIMTEKLNKQEKDAIGKRAPTANKITLMVKPFGRGTDFVVRDNLALNNGGPHVISTFLSEQESKEYQIKGRTARQGRDGLFSLVLIESSNTSNSHYD